MNESGAVIINIDDKNLAGIFTIPQDIITIGVDNRMADYFADNIELSHNKISFDIIHGADNYHIEFIPMISTAYIRLWRDYGHTAKADNPCN